MPPTPPTPPTPPLHHLSLRAISGQPKDPELRDNKECRAAFVPDLLGELGISIDTSGALSFTKQVFEWHEKRTRAIIVDKPGVIQNLERNISASRLTEYFDIDQRYSFNWKIARPPDQVGFEYGPFERWHIDGPNVDFNLTITLIASSGLTRVWCGSEEMEFPYPWKVGSALFFSGGTTHSEPLMPDGRLSLLLRLQRKDSFRSMEATEFLSLLKEKLFPKMEQFRPEQRKRVRL